VLSISSLESDLAASAYVELVGGSDVVDEEVHQTQFVAEADERPQTGRVQRDAVRILRELTVQLQLTTNKHIVKLTG